MRGRVAAGRCRGLVSGMAQMGPSTSSFHLVDFKKNTRLAEHLKASCYMTPDSINWLY